MVTIFNDLKCFPVQNTSDVPLKSVRQVSAVRQNQPRHAPLIKTGCVRLAACQRWGQAAWQAWAAAILTKPMYTQQEIESVNSIWFGVTNQSLSSIISYFLDSGSKGNEGQNQRTQWNMPQQLLSLLLLPVSHLLLTSSHCVCFPEGHCWQVPRLISGKRRMSDMFFWGKHHFDR